MVLQVINEVGLARWVLAAMNRSGKGYCHLIGVRHPSCDCGLCDYTELLGAEADRPVTFLEMRKSGECYAGNRASMAWLGTVQIVLEPKAGHHCRKGAVSPSRRKARNLLGLAFLSTQQLLQEKACQAAILSQFTFTKEPMAASILVL